MPISRDSTGLLFRDTFNRPNGAVGADYTQTANLSATIDANELLLNTTSGGNDSIWVSSLAARSGAYFFARLRKEAANSEASLLAAHDPGSSQGYLLQFYGSGANLFRQTGTGTFTQIGSGTYNPAAGAWFTAAIYATHGPTGKQRTWLNGAALHNTADTYFAAAFVGKPASRCSVANQATRHDDWVVCTTHTVSISGLATGQKAQIKDAGGGIVAGPVAESAGTAVIDVGGVVLPAARIEVVDAAGAPVEGFAPAGGVWGGDTYSYAAAGIWRACLEPAAPRAEQAVDLDALGNAAVSASDGLTTGVTLSGFARTDVVVVDPNMIGRYVAWSPWGRPTLAGIDTGTVYDFSIIKDVDPATEVRYSAGGPFDGYPAARNAFIAAYPFGVQVTGAERYTFYIRDTPIADNSGGLSLRVRALAWRSCAAPAGTSWSTCP